MDQAVPGHLHQARREVSFHDGDGDHVHEVSVGRRGELVEYIWKVENVELSTVGVDIGSSTSHLMFATVRLQRRTQSLSSEFVVVERRVLWKSPILMTPFLADGSIDAQALGAFVARCFADAGLDRSQIDTGAVILTGEAIKRTNARAIAELFATESGKFVCASAGHGLECVLAAHGSGAVAISRETARTVLNVDIGGGTTKLALIANGEIVATCAVAVGGRLPVDESAVDALADALISVIAGEKTETAQTLLLTGVLPLPWERAGERVALAFSGGVSEYIYGRETRDFGDIGKLLAARIRSACDSGRIATPVLEPREGIRATVIGASQFTVQVSGKTIHIGAGVQLPLRNVPVIAPALMLSEEISSAAVASAIRTVLARAPSSGEESIALAIRWRGDPHHRRLRALAEGIAAAVPPLPWERAGERVNATLALMIDGDIGRTLGHILEHELRIGRPVLSIDGIQLKEFDFVDIGAVIRPAEVVPIVIKSLLFSGAPTHAPPRATLAYQSVTEERLQ